MLDIGCGPGGMVQYALDEGLNAVGIDGDYSIERTVQNIIIHDYTFGQFNMDTNYDLAWSVEFLEHVDEKFVPHFMHSFKYCKYAIVTAAPPGWPGHHHVNCRDQEYWKGAFAANGFEYDAETTKEVYAASTMAKGFMKLNGMFFRKFNYDN
jgi:cyclopropane fatty-acyl-phospholipid synthase-like methyltransferase